MRLLPQIFSVEAQSRIGMKRCGKREPAFKNWFEPSLGHRTFLTPTTEGAQPTLAPLLPKTVKAGEISWDGVVVEIAL